YRGRMTIAPAMAEPAHDELEEGAPVPDGYIDQKLVRLSRTRHLKVGVITAAGLVFLCGYFLLRLGPDRRFAAERQPRSVGSEQFLPGVAALGGLVAVRGEPMMSQAIRSTTSKASMGLRVVPLRGTGDRLWLVLHGDGWDPPAKDVYVGRLRPL